MFTSWNQKSSLCNIPAPKKCNESSQIHTDTIETETVLYKIVDYPLVLTLTVMYKNESTNGILLQIQPLLESRYGHAFENCNI